MIDEFVQRSAIGRVRHDSGHAVGQPGLIQKVPARLTIAPVHQIGADDTMAMGLQDLSQSAPSTWAWSAVCSAGHAPGPLPISLLLAMAVPRNLITPALRAHVAITGVNQDRNSLPA
jgi:hypothetical protein